MRILDPFAVNTSTMIAVTLVNALAFSRFRHHCGKQLESPVDLRVIDCLMAIQQVAAEICDGFADLEVIGRIFAGNNILFNLAAIF